MSTITINAVGALTWSLPEGRDLLTFDKDNVSVQEVLDALVLKHGNLLQRELFTDGELRSGLCLIANGRNVLSLPGGFETPLKDGSELIIAVIMAGG